MKMLQVLAGLLGLCVFVSDLSAQEPVCSPYSKRCVQGASDSVVMNFVDMHQIYDLQLQSTPEIQFWRRIMTLTPDSGLLSVATTRQVIAQYEVKSWEKQSDDVKEAVRDSVRRMLGLSDSVSVYFTPGKKDFYDVEGVVTQIDQGVRIFENNNTDPFYAQAILLIESPAKMKKSNVGAYGPFQLMRGVAVNMGLKVNKTVDERKDFDKSAWAAAKLIRTVCIPYTNAMLDKRGICYDPTDLWYRLLVLHVYHAGAGNVEKALATFEPKDGNIDIIKTLWHTRAGDFGKASQTYSQVAVSAMLELDTLLSEKESEPRTSGN